MIRHHRRGFTLIELLVVVGIIGVLVAIGVLGYVHFDKVAATKLTNTRLQMCASLLTQFDPSGALIGIEGSGAIFAGVKPAGSNPGDVTLGFSATRFSNPGAVYSTAQVFQLFSRIPDVRTTIAQLPSEAIMQNTSGTGGAWFDPVTKQPLPVILDGWKNPIIYVPSGGLPGVYIGGPPPNGNMQTGIITGTSHTVKSVDGRPFWASAGADGNFRSGDDNVYSCPVIYGP